MSRRRSGLVAVRTEHANVKDIHPYALRELHFVARHLAVLEAAVANVDVAHAACGHICQWGLLGKGEAALACVVHVRIRHVGGVERVSRAVGCGE